MKTVKMTSRLFCTLLILVITGMGLRAQQKPLENSLLWEISGKGLTKPSYLYGTIHMICSNDFRMSDQVKKAFDNTAKLVLEIDMFSPAVAAEMQKALIADTPLSARLPPPQYALIDSLLKQQTGLSLQVFDNFRLMALVSFLSRMGFACDSLRIYEAEFKQMADKKQLQLASLETLQEQMGFFDKAFPDDSIVSQLNTLDLQEMRTKTAQMVQYYQSEELENVYKKIIEEKGMNESALHWLLEARNANWVKKMPGMMEEGSTFFAVGAGHLAGDKGVIRLLRETGYTVKPVLH
jgi:uncharacterized protein YbaP (TraB family)